MYKIQRHHGREDDYPHQTRREIRSAMPGNALTGRWDSLFPPRTAGLSQLMPNTSNPSLEPESWEYFIFYIWSMLISYICKDLSKLISWTNSVYLLIDLIYISPQSTFMRARILSALATSLSHKMSWISAYSGSLINSCWMQECSRVIFLKPISYHATLQICRAPHCIQSTTENGLGKQVPLYSSLCKFYQQTNHFLSLLCL